MNGIHKTTYELLMFYSVYSYLSYKLPELKSPEHFCDKASLPMNDRKKFVICLVNNHPGLLKLSLFANIIHYTFKHSILVLQSVNYIPKCFIAL